jgi:hypothetical protein
MGKRGFRKKGTREMTLREEALKLADDIAEYAPDTNIEVMLRRLVDHIDWLNDETKFDMDGRC